MRRKKGKKVVFIILAVILFIAVFGAVVMYLWNWLVPPIFNGPEVTYFQAIGLLVLSKILLGSFGGKGRGGWNDKWKSRWQHMTPEERSGLKKRFMNKWGCSPQWESDQHEATSDTIPANPKS